MPRSTELLASALIALAAFSAAPAALAQAPAQQGQSASSQPSKAIDDPAPGQSPGGIQGQNIFDVKPEVKRDASNDPGYMDQTNGQRNAVQPGNNSPMWRDVQRGMAGYSSLPRSQAPEAGVLIQAPVQYPGSRLTTAGEAWRQVRNNWIIPYGGALVVITIVALLIFWFTRGMIGHNEAVGGGGRRIERFTPFERAAHWTNAIAFVVLGLSGIVMAFGKFFLLPIMGGTLFGYFTYLLKNLHNFFGPLFAVSLLIVIITFIKDEFPRKGDLAWLAKFGGVFSKSGEEPPTHRFNAGEKVVFWAAVVVLGLVVVGSGLVLDKLVPSIDYVRSTMQQAHMIHAVAAVLMVCLIGFHIYLGTLGVRGAYGAMRHGYVDEAWAREHHGYWLDDIEAGKIPAQRSTPPGTPLPGEPVRTV
ncbi:formate dehydrogenase subunit gamma [Ramlibacter sp. Leaf400]|uniref:formate dehydrogenase subunit gamma n=1 Tax=Ramlibacter sp. Leaf400 TaxID=1736365 RepID=UPI0006F85D8D|nr:formate dehydrogenase subunit gamma [Ramlibacter sp. Leaf400]KQT09693.1 formate dehydrogenase [Ramlibacter sp. Leaf400]